jgi:hypothetical protein
VVLGLIDEAVLSATRRDQASTIAIPSRIDRLRLELRITTPVVCRLIH